MCASVLQRHFKAIRGFAAFAEPYPGPAAMCAPVAEGVPQAALFFK